MKSKSTLTKTFNGPKQQSKAALTLNWAAVLGLISASLSGASAFATSQTPLPNFDHRQDTRAASTAQKKTPAQTAAAAPAQKSAELIKSRVGNLKISRETVTGRPAFISSPTSFLTGTNGEGLAVTPSSASGFAANDRHRGLKAFLTEHKDLFGFGPEALAAAKIDREFVSKTGGVNTTVWTQEHDGMRVFGAEFRAHHSRRGELINVDNHFVVDPAAATVRGNKNHAALLAKPVISARQALKLAMENLGETADESLFNEQHAPQGKSLMQRFQGNKKASYARAELNWLPMDDASMRLCWDVVLTSRSRGESYRLQVDAETGEIPMRQCLTEYLSSAQYNVFTADSPTPMLPTLSSPATTQPTQVSRTLVTLSALDTTASPNGWINDGDNTTMGNNVDAHLDVDNDNVPDANSRPVGSPFRVFNPPLDLTQQPSTYQAAAVVNVFYWNNWMHDKLYSLGFDEAAGNFQNDRFGKGGLAFTAVQADAQDASVSDNSTNPPGPAQLNNANFSVLPFEQAPRMQMYLFNGVSPKRDGDLDATVICHEYTHGLSGRLAGGSFGLGALQSRGMGEGWSDFYALSLLTPSTGDPNACYAIGPYVVKNSGGNTNNYYFGIRRYPYTTDLTKNPLTLKDIDQAQRNLHSGVPINPSVSVDSATNATEVHYVGEVWCNMLWECRARLIARLGNAAGNLQMLQLVTEGMKLSPLNPAFDQARDCIIQADLLLTGGANNADLWAAFARHGLGFNANCPTSANNANVQEDYTVPPAAQFPVVTITSPAELQSFPGTPSLAGKANFSTGYIRFQLKRSDGKYYNPTNGTWGSVQAYFIASGVANWSATLPALAPDVYFVLASGIDTTRSYLSGVAYRNFLVDTTAPTLSITNPVANAHYATPPVASGVFQDGNFGTHVQVVLNRSSDGAWYNFASNTWGTSVFDAARNILPAMDNGTVWTAAMPDLSKMSDGDYEIQAKATDHAGNATAWIVKDFTMESVAPTVTFNPLTNNEQIFDLRDLGGTVDRPSTIKFRIQQYDVSGNNDLYWNGSSWLANGDDPSVWLAGAVLASYWGPANTVNLPGRANTRPGPYFLRVSATGSSGVSATNEIVVNRTSTDTTPPTVSFSSIYNNQVFTNPSIPTITGLAADNESGIASVQVYLMRATSPGFVYWNGSSWISTPAALTTTYSGGIWSVNMPQPGGANLPNASYQIQASANNQESPQGSQTVSINFSVDFHPRYVFTAGSLSDTNPSNDNMRWDNPANWDQGQVPPDYAVVVINSYVPDNTALGSVSQYGVNISGGTLATAGMLIQKLTMTGGAISGGAVTIPAGGVFNWSGGYLAGTFTVSSNAVVNISGADNKGFSSGALNNLGTMIWGGTGALMGPQGFVLNNSNLFSVQGDALFYNYTGGSPVPVFNNYGIFQKTNSSGTTSLDSGNGGWLFNNNAAILDVESGTFQNLNALNIFSGSSLTGLGRVTSSGGTCFLDGSIRMVPNSTFELAGGYLTGQSQFTNGGTFIWSGGTINGTNTVAADSSMLISGASPRNLNGAVTNRGFCWWIDSNTIYAAQFSIFENAGTFVSSADAVYYNYTGGSPLPLFVNKGSFTKDSSGLLDFNNGNGGVQFDNNGALISDAGTMRLGGGGNHHNGSFNVASNAVVDMNAGAHSFGAQLTFKNAGTVRFSGGTLNLGGATEVMTNNPTWEIAGGMVTGTGSFSGTGNVNWSGGTIASGLTLFSNITFNIQGENTKSLGGTAAVFCAGPASWNGGGYVYAGQGTSLTSSNTFIVSNDSRFYNYSGGSPLPQFYNYGTFLKTNSTGVTGFDTGNGGVAFNNFGTLSVASGVVSLAGGGSWMNDSVLVSPGAVLSLDGGTFYQDGVHAIGGGGSNWVNGASVTFDTNVVTMAANTSFELMNGNLLGHAVFGGTGRMNWSGGTISGGLVAQSSVGLNMMNVNPRTLNGSLAAYGPNTWSGNAQLYMAQTSSFTNGGTMIVTGDALVYNYTGGSPTPQFYNYGVILKTNSLGNTVFSGANGGTAFNNYGTLNVASGSLELAGGGVSQNDALIAGAAGLITQTGGSFALNGTHALSGPGTNLVNGATLTFNNAGVGLSGSPKFELASGTVAGGVSFNGAGAFNWSGGTLGAVLNTSSNVMFNINGNNGKTMSGGVLTLNGPGNWNGQGDLAMAQNCSIINNSGFAVFQPGRLVNYTAGSPLPFFSNNGTLIKSGAGTFEFNSVNGGVQYNSRGDTVVSNGEFLMSAGGSSTNSVWFVNTNCHATFQGGAFTMAGSTLFNGAGSSRLTGGTMLFAVGLVNLAGSFEIQGGEADGLCTFNGAGPLVWGQGTIGGDFTLQPAVNFNINYGDVILSYGGLIRNAGHATWSGGNIQMASGCVITNSGTWEIKADSQFMNYTGGTQPQVYNSGLFVKSAGTGGWGFHPSNSGVGFKNTGTVDLRSGNFAVLSSYATSPASQTKFVIGGLTANTQFGTEYLPNGLLLDGALSISLTNGFAPTNGQSFVIITGGTRSGQFSSVQFPPISSDYQWTLQYDNNSVTARVILANRVKDIFRSADGKTHLSIVGVAGSSSVIQASTNLVNWAPIYTNAPFTGAYDFVDSAATNMPMRFYHVTIVP